LIVVNVGDFDSDSTCVLVLFGLDDLIVLGQRLLSHAVGFQTQCVVQSHSEYQVHVDHFGQVGVLL
jgi:hypothetical protein